MLACSTIRALDGQSDMSMQPDRAECEYRWRLRECRARSNRLFPFMRNESLPSAGIDGMPACSTIRALDGQSDMSMQPDRAECEYRWRLRECRARSNRLFPFIRNENLPQRPDRWHKLSEHWALSLRRRTQSNRGAAGKDKLRADLQNSIGMRISLSFRTPRSPLPPL